MSGTTRDDPLHSSSGPHEHWATSNLGEAMPGVLTPLSWSLWSVAAERGARESAYSVGAIPAKERSIPAAVEDRIIRIFHGRAAMLVEHMALIGDRMPGTTGREVVNSIFGSVPADMRFTPTRRRYPFVALRFPISFATVPRKLRAIAADHDAWWSTAVAGVDDLDRAAATALFSEARARFNRAVPLQSIAFVCVIQPLFDAVERLVKQIGSGNVAKLSGASGNAEVELPLDLWKASRGTMSMEELVARYGYHGPGDGEISATVWREDDTALRKLVEQYAARDDSHDPVARDTERRRGRAEAERAALRGSPFLQRLPVWLLLTLARRRLPLRGVSKQAFLQALDVARATARRIGEHLVAEGVLDSREDVFYLTADELTGPLPADVRELVKARARCRAEHQQVRLPETWTGMPAPLSTSPPVPDRVDVVHGTGVSAGIVEGTVRVVLDPDFGDVQPDEVLVAPTTDPSWASIMFLSSALVVDIGGALSHAAVVARELDIPCVVNTGNATRVLRTGDQVRVDGSAGTIEILNPA